MRSTGILHDVRRSVLEEKRDLTLGELRALADLPPERIPSLAGLAHEVRVQRCGPEVEVEGILSAKTGGCPEDCHFCSQSSRFESPVRPTGYLDFDEVLTAARETARLGASEFCIVMALRGPDDATVDRVVAAGQLICAETGLNVAASLGILTRAQAERLAHGGIHRYNHNLETSRSFFPEIVTTHSFQEPFRTCLLVRDVGMELCCGAIL